MIQPVERPKHRGRFRQWAGKEFYIFRRRLIWWTGSEKWAGLDGEQMPCSHLVKNHRSLILRPLKDVDMRLQENKRTNLRLAVARMNGVQIRPGETFSVWKLVGRPTRRKGYLEGLVLQNGTICSGTGGGLCQLGNLLFWLFAHSPLTITERYRHGYDVFPDVNRNVPFGAGATLSYNYIDLQVRNDSDQTFLLQLWLDDEYLNGNLFSDAVQQQVYHIEERDHTMQQQFWGGYTRHNRIMQVCTLEDGSMTEKLLVENHAIMRYSPFLENKESGQ